MRNSHNSLSSCIWPFVVLYFLCVISFVWAILNPNLKNKNNLKIWINSLSRGWQFRPWSNVLPCKCQKLSWSQPVSWSVALTFWYLHLSLLLLSCQQWGQRSFFPHLLKNCVLLYILTHREHFYFCFSPKHISDLSMTLVGN